MASDKILRASEDYSLTLSFKRRLRIESHHNLSRSDTLESSSQQPIGGMHLPTQISSHCLQVLSGDTPARHFRNKNCVFALIRLSSQRISRSLRQGSQITGRLLALPAMGLPGSAVAQSLDNPVRQLPVGRATCLESIKTIISIMQLRNICKMRLWQCCPLSVFWQDVSLQGKRCGDGVRCQKPRCKF